MPSSFRWAACRSQPEREQGLINANQVEIRCKISASQQSHQTEVGTHQDSKGAASRAGEGARGRAEATRSGHASFGSLRVMKKRSSSNRLTAWAINYIRLSRQKGFLTSQTACCIPCIIVMLGI